MKMAEDIKVGESLIVPKEKRHDQPKKFKLDIKDSKLEDPMYYYKLAMDRGIDYNFYGDWQKNYAKMIFNICEVIRRTGKAKPNMLDVGCACGVNTRAFRELNTFSSVKGCDSSEFMINLGRKTHGFSEQDLFVAYADNIHQIKSNTIDFLHCSNVLEHCDESDIKPILNEFRRIVQPEGIIFLCMPTITDANTEATIRDNPDHKTIKPFRWWENLIDKQFEIQSEIYQKFEEDKHSPDNSKKTFYNYYNAEWTLFLLTRR
jgi:ubiquinone/menaquinone biosynthesis C-methylase UbiE